MGLKVRHLHAWEVLDSRGKPTLAVEAELSNSVRGSFKVPSGASTGKHEAVELRDGDLKRYQGQGVLKAADHVRQTLAPALEDVDAEDQQALDRAMIELDGSPNKSRLGANAILAVSCAVAGAVARSQGVPLWRRLAGDRTPSLPLPMINILSGGLHAGGNIEFQDFLAVPHGLPSFSQAIEAAAAIHKTAGQMLRGRGYALTGVADEGGWGPLLKTNEEALEILTSSIEQAGYKPGEQVSIAIDVAATHFFEGGAYVFRREQRRLSSDQMVDQLYTWSRRFPILSIEDGLAEDDWEGWRLLNKTLGGFTQLVGDDLFTTNPARVEKGIHLQAANAVLVKLNQIGTLTETLAVAGLARKAGFRAVISARSGETEDSFLADLAVATGAGQIKVGSVTRSERLAKYNRLLEMEARTDLPYAGASALNPFLERQAELKASAPLSPASSRAQQ